jgi:hypothetical protein
MEMETDSVARIRANQLQIVMAVREPKWQIVVTLLGCVNIMPLTADCYKGQPVNLNYLTKHSYNN